MTLIQKVAPNRISLQAEKQGVRSATFEALAPVFEKTKQNRYRSQTLLI